MDKSRSNLFYIAAAVFAGHILMVFFLASAISEFAKGVLAAGTFIAGILCFSLPFEKAPTPQTESKKETAS